jgi:hypothetical protein
MSSERGPLHQGSRSSGRGGVMGGADGRRRPRTTGCPRVKPGAAPAHSCNSPRSGAVPRIAGPTWREVVSWPRSAELGAGRRPADGCLIPGTRRGRGAKPGAKPARQGDKEGIGTGDDAGWSSATSRAGRWLRIGPIPKGNSGTRFSPPPRQHFGERDNRDRAPVRYDGLAIGGHAGQRDGPLRHRHQMRRRRPGGRGVV